MLEHVMPTKDAHGANLLLSRLLAEPWLRLSLFHPLFSHVTKSTSSISHNAKIYLKTNAIPLNAHGALHLQSRMHAETHKWLSHSQPLSSNATTYLNRRSQSN